MTLAHSATVAKKGGMLCAVVNSRTSAFELSGEGKHVEWA